MEVPLDDLQSSHKFLFMLTESANWRDWFVGEHGKIMGVDTIEEMIKFILGYNDGPITQINIIDNKLLIENMDNYYGSSISTYICCTELLFDIKDIFEKKLGIYDNKYLNEILEIKTF